jgi:phosphoglycolate phosphatase-like HAD superfamily hydrolase
MMTKRTTAGATRPLLVLDFDGVICDSVEECFASSWTAYHELFLGLPGSEAPVAARAEFRAMRPFVRSGEDFVLVQELVHRKAGVASQAEFDHAWQRPGIPPHKVFKDLFYQARSTLMGRDRQAWLAMNPIYPHAATAIRGLPPVVEFFILSTKKAQFVRETLAANGIPVPPQRVLYSEDEPKLSIVEKLLQVREGSQAIFVEDQIDAIRGNTNPRIQVYLASWGYVQKSWMEETPAVPLLTPEGFVKLLAGLG